MNSPSGAVHPTTNTNNLKSLTTSTAHHHTKGQHSGVAVRTPSFSAVDKEDATERDAMSEEFSEVFPTQQSAIVFGEYGANDGQMDLEMNHVRRGSSAFQDDQPFDDIRYHHDKGSRDDQILNGWKKIILDRRFSIGVVSFLLIAVTVLFGIILILLLTLYNIDKGAPINSDGSVWTPPVTESGAVQLVKATNGAAAADNEICSNIGVKILRDLNGNAVDAAVATTFCIGIMNPFSAGIGGGGIMGISIPSSSPNTKDTVEYIDFREKAPLAATWDMYSSLSNSPAPPSQRGGKSIAVLSEIKGLYTAWKRYGSLPWNVLIQPSIDLARNGVKANSVIASHLNKYKKWVLEETFGSGMKQLYAVNGEVKKEGDLLQYFKLADTLEIVAKEGADAIYSMNGSLIQHVVEDIRKAGGIISEEDLINYDVKIYSTRNQSKDGTEEDISTPLSTYFMGYQVYGPRPEISGGSCVIFLLNMLENYVRELMEPLLNHAGQLYQANQQFHMSQQKYALFIEALKFTFAHRADLADPEFVKESNKVMEDMISKDYSAQIRTAIDRALVNNKTFSDPLHYKHDKMNLHYVRDDHGTSHLNVLDKNGMAVSLTTTVNLIFGSFVVGDKTGIIFNDQMDDFSLPNTTNYFGLAPSPSNYIDPGKRPLSSMSPTIIHKNNKFYMAVGASGGSRIISSVFQTIWNHIVGGLNIAQSIQFPRIHHQWSPVTLAVEQGIPEELIAFFKSFLGYNGNGNESTYINRVKGNAEFSVGIVQGIVKKGDNNIEAASDIRKKSKAAGY
ncbi:hypothetical protein C9374_013899 [Naegleria lovaniensis]|uniref:Gamma-glutamyltransferase n=1 Tax=Naegleria lovaniensis TaxID=51637 RepID=A0AA88H0K5_NAELO|nr:uncharacterized protein C9374_013899 [Naegleria lovaniensis]KAG2389339.1 hypothetical protein C9374_013899 [Naegleria lovaniensis]